jgi:hypothetical protein
VTVDPSRVVLDRLRAVAWHDLDSAYDHVRSRAKLMREYLRRAACWAEAVGAEDAWPFFDIARRVDPEARASSDVEAELEDFLWNTIGRRSLEETCRGAVRWPALRSRASLQLPDLPDPYAPLLLMYERGGGFSVEELIDIDGASLPFWTLEDHLSLEPFESLDDAALDALDARPDALRSFIEANLNLETAYDDMRLTRGTLRAAAPQWAESIRAGLAAAIAGREISVGEYGRMTAIEFPDEDALYRYLSGVYEYLFEGRDVETPTSRKTYYAVIDETHPRATPLGVVRRAASDGAVRDEAFTRNLRWEPTEYLRRYELGHNDDDHVEITAAEADAFVERLVREAADPEP